MDAKQIISFENGKLYIKLEERFDTSRMEVRATLAEITRDHVHVVKADSHGEISSTSMTLPAVQFALLTEGMQMVEQWWDKPSLKKGEVLLDCGCIINWDKEQEFLHDTHEEYEMPFQNKEVYCGEHECYARLHRFNWQDFCEDEEQEQKEEQPA